MAVTTGQTKGADGKARNSETYGVLWLSAKTGTDKEARIVALDDLTVDKGSFPSAPDQEARYLAAARKAFPTTQLVVSLDAIERSEEHTSELQSLMRISYAVFCLE